MVEAIGFETGKNWKLDTLVLLPLLVMSLDLDMEQLELEPDPSQGKKEMGLEKTLCNRMAGQH